MAGDFEEPEPTRAERLAALRDEQNNVAAERRGELIAAQLERTLTDGEELELARVNAMVSVAFPQVTADHWRELIETERKVSAHKLQALQTAIDGARPIALTNLPTTKVLLTDKHWQAIVDARGGWV